jgi:hypothetical protein
MAFDNQLGRGKDRRKPYYDTRRFDWTCRNHGSCGYCEDRRTFANKRRSPIIILEELDTDSEWNIYADHYDSEY